MIIGASFVIVLSFLTAAVKRFLLCHPLGVLGGDRRWKLLLARGVLIFKIVVVIIINTITPGYSIAINHFLTLLFSITHLILLITTSTD